MWLTPAYSDRIARLDFAISSCIKMKLGSILWVYSGLFRFFQYLYETLLRLCVKTLKIWFLIRRIWRYLSWSIVIPISDKIPNFLIKPIFFNVLFHIALKNQNSVLSARLTVNIFENFSHRAHLNNCDCYLFFDLFDQLMHLFVFVRIEPNYLWMVALVQGSQYIIERAQHNEI